MAILVEIKCNCCNVVVDDAEQTLQPNKIEAGDVSILLAIHELQIQNVIFVVLYIWSTVVCYTVGCVKLLYSFISQQLFNQSIHCLVYEMFANRKMNPQFPQNILKLCLNCPKFRAIQFSTILNLFLINFFAPTNWHKDGLTDSFSATHRYSSAHRSPGRSRCRSDSGSCRWCFCTAHSSTGCLSSCIHLYLR